jgi:hypothetical protein
MRIAIFITLILFCFTISTCEQNGNENADVLFKMLNTPQHMLDRFVDAKLHYWNQVRVENLLGNRINYADPTG